MTTAELREIATQMILAKVREGYTIDEAVKEILKQRKRARA